MNFVLGTVQLGLRYGLNDVLMSASLAEQILAAALERGVAHLDTAAVYGESELRIGSFASQFSVVSKLPPDIAGMGENAVMHAMHERTELCRARVCLTHRFSDFADSTVRTTLFQAVADGQFDRVGASVSSPEELQAALDLGAQQVQFPSNVFDSRWHEILPRLKNYDCITHIRSVFFQGLALAEQSTWPSIFVDAWADRVQGLADEMTGGCKISLTLAYAKSLPVDGCVLGVDSLSQLLELVDKFESAAVLSERQQNSIHNTFVDFPETLLNPANW